MREKERWWYPTRTVTLSELGVTHTDFSQSEPRVEPRNSYQVWTKMAAGDRYIPFGYKKYFEKISANKAGPYAVRNFVSSNTTSSAYFRREGKLSFEILS